MRGNNPFRPQSMMGGHGKKNVLPITKEGATLERLREVFGAANIQEYSIVIIKDLTSNKQNQTFKLAGRTPNPRPTEEYLSSSDAFAAIEASWTLGQLDTTTTNNEGNVIYTPYPEPAFFGAQALDLEAVYNGFFGVKAGTDEIVFRQQMKKFRIVPRTPAQGTFNAPTVLPCTDSEGGEFRPLNMIPVILGTKATDLEFTYAQGANASNLPADSATTKTLLRLELRGFVIRNVTESFTNFEAIKYGVLQAK